MKLILNVNFIYLGNICLSYTIEYASQSIFFSFAKNKVKEKELKRKNRECIAHFFSLFHSQFIIDLFFSFSKMLLLLSRPLQIAIIYYVNVNHKQSRSVDLCDETKKEI